MSFAWLVIYLNIPLWVTIGILAFAFNQWDITKFILYGNIVLLFISLLCSRPVRLREDTLHELEKYKKEGQTWDGVVKGILGKLRGKRKKPKEGKNEKQNTGTN